MDSSYLGSFVFSGIFLIVVFAGLLLRSKALLRAERRVTHSLANTGDGFFVLDKDYRFTFANRRAAEILGTGGGILTGKSLLEVLPEKKDSRLYIEVTEALRNRCPVRFECFHQTVNRWFEHHITAGTENDIAVSSRDITSRKRLEGALRASEERFSKLIESNIIGVLVVRSDFIMEANDRFLEMIGYSRGELVPGRLSCSEITPREFENRDSHAREEMLLHGACSPFEKEFVRKDGTKVPVLVCATAIGDDPSTESLFLVQDLSQQKRAERLVNYIVNASRVLESSLEQDRVLQLLADFLVEDIADGCIIYTQEENQLYRIASAAKTIEMASALNDVDADRNRLYLEHVVKSGKSDLWPGMKSHPFRSCALIPLPVRDGTAGLLLVVSASDSAFGDDDVRMLEELGRRAGVALENARLYLHANEANRLKDEFVAIVSHELRTPLTPILGAAYMLRHERYDEKVFNRALDLIERNAKAQAKIVEDLLDVSRILSGKLRLNWELVEMEPVVYAAIDTIRPASDAKGVQIEASVSPIRNPVRGDAGRLQQVVWNLLANSVKFTPQGGRITVHLEELEGFAELRVTDTGIGIGPDFLPHVFDRFRQEDASRTRMHGGLGLGLAIVRHLVESHSGTVHALSSGDKQGSTFVVRLPLRAFSEATRTAQAGD